MSKKKMRELPTMINNPRVVIYNDEDINYIVGNGVSFEWEPQYITYESFDGTRTPFDMGVVATIHLNNAETLENIKLDDTLMKRIAVFNKEQQCKRLDEEIRNKRKRIEEIETILEDRERRLMKLKEFVRHIYEIDVEDDEEWDE